METPGRLLSPSLRDFIGDISFAAMLLKRDMLGRYAGNMAGLVHAYLVPFLTLALYAVIFSFIFGGRISGARSDISYAVYLCSGLVLWLVVAEVLPRSTGLFIEFSQILRQRNQRLRGIFLFLFFLNIQLFVFFFASLLVLHILNIVVFDLAGFAISIIFMPIAALYLVAIGIILAFASTFLPDLRSLMPVLLQIGFWGSPITYSENIVPPHWQALYGVLMSLNPFYAVLKIFQGLMTTGSFPEPEIGIQAAAWFVLTSTIAALVIRRFSAEVSDFV